MRGRSMSCPGQSAIPRRVFAIIGTITEKTTVLLLDHFRPPLSSRRPWQSFHTTWASTLADTLNREVLPPGYIALEQVHAGPAIEIDVATSTDQDAAVAGHQDGGTTTVTRAV